MIKIYDFFFGVLIKGFIKLRLIFFRGVLIIYCFIGVLGVFVDGLLD